MSNDMPITMPCPVCGHDATWTAKPAPTGSGTAYRIDCPHCDGWSVQAQMQRALERRAA